MADLVALLATGAADGLLAVAFGFSAPTPSIYCDPEYRLQRRLTFAGNDCRRARRTCRGHGRSSWAQHGAWLLVDLEMVASGEGELPGGARGSSLIRRMPAREYRCGRDSNPIFGTGIAENGRTPTEQGKANTCRRLLGSIRERRRCAGA